ncbi:MAG: porin [Rhodospirillales bacterium]|nr:porin [Rhodospirillales bacterium]
MKKILLGTTAVVALATLSTEAFAADKIKLGLGGFMRHYVGVSNHDEVAVAANGGANRGVKLQQWDYSEIHFKGDTTLDNGLNVAVKVETGATKTGGRAQGVVDVSQLTISSDAMGALTVGSTPHAGDDFLVRVPQVNGFDWGDTDKFGAVAVDAATDSAAFATSSVDITDMGAKGGKLKYVTPTFSGFTGYASYAAAEVNGSNITIGVAGRNGAHDASTMGVAYEGELSGVAVSADVTHFRNNGTSNVTHGGLNVGMAGFTVGGGYSDFSDDATTTGVAAGVTQNNTLDGNAWELGVGYETGPYSLAVGYMSAESDGTFAALQQNEDTKWNVGVAYDLGAGVKLTADYFHSNANPEDTVAAPTTIAEGMETTVSGVLAGIEVGF